MKTSETLGKSIVLATFIFWLVLYDETHLDQIWLILLSIIPISICVTITILITIFPWFSNSKNNSKKVFNIGFPIYSGLLFMTCIYASFISDFDVYVTSFLSSVYITTCYAWLCYSKTSNL